MSNPREIFVNIKRCTGCKTCEISCAVEHSKAKNLYSAISELPTPKARLSVEWHQTAGSIPVLCRQCDDAPCMHACITGAIKRDVRGAIVTDTDKCIGCWTCVMVCPFGVIGRHLQIQKAYRCDRCPDREIPACVESCPTKALVFKTVDEYSTNKRYAFVEEMSEAIKQDV
ncbi:MAG: 4Fe-4S dicluster domain-containing protein [Thermodesulfovibrionales bacterium]|nr:4Fe-4S dicluster domain-containing protein [Thermodesulfovibrionales bacterium]